MKKKVNYLGYLLINNNKETEHVENQIPKAWAIVGKVWGVGQRLMKGNWKERIRTFSVLE